MRAARPIRMGQRAQPLEPSSSTTSAGTKLGSLLDALAARDSATTTTLCACCELDSRQVWGLLKAPRAMGRVRFEAGRWSLNPDYRGAAVERAAELLRARGWTVIPPEGS
jgi:hypothetical protein